MIITRLIGGLGNQLFQYALGRRLAYRHGVPLKLDITGFETYTLHKYSLHNFALEAAIASAQDLEPYRSTPVRRILRRLNRFIPVQRRWWVVEPHIRFAREILDAGPNVYLNGYWQSEKYFADIAPLLRNEIRVTVPLEGRDAEVAHSINHGPSAAVHVRRGDYINNSTHGLCSTVYYEEAMRRVEEHAPDVRFFVFSDDARWAREAFGHLERATVVGHNGADKNYEDFRLMSLCRHHIIANSTFSWWAAWLSSHPEKMVVAPRIWFQDSVFDSRDVVPESWVRI